MTLPIVNIGRTFGLLPVPVDGVDFNYTVTDSSTRLPVSGVKVNIYSDAEGERLFASDYTNSLGVASFKIDAAVGTTLYVGVIKSGYSEYDSLDAEIL